LQALLSEPSIGKIVLVISNSPTAPALLRAKRAGVKTLVSRPLNWREIRQALEFTAVERIFLAGFMRIVPEDFVQEWTGKMLNIHPSLLPTYPGLDSIARAYEEKAPLGATVHEVTPVVDGGRRIVQREIGTDKRFLLATDLEEVSLRVHIHEHHLVRQAVRQWGGGLNATNS
jgi:phosphoribosylglycinamide formyltransferase-1